MNPECIIGEHGPGRLNFRSPTRPMTAMPESYKYRIDRDDIVVFVSDNWTRFAVDNAAGAQASATSVVGRALHEFIDGEETCSLYALVLDSIRCSNRPVTFRFRCDSPAERRFCEMKITPGTDGSVDFESRILQTESRQSVPLLHSDVRRDPDKFLKACSACKRIAMDNGEWIEIEQAMQRLKLGELERAPRISHGLCAGCHESIIASL